MTPPWAAMPVMTAAHGVLADAVVDETAARVVADWAVAPPAPCPVLPVRSALPAMRPGNWSWVASRAALMALRVAMGPSAGVNVGSFASHPGSPWPR